MIEEMIQTCFANRLRAAARTITKHYDAELRPLDIKVSQLSVLAAVSFGSGELSIVEIASRLAMDRSTLSRNLDPLARRGLLSLGPEERHRARKVAVTEAGEALLRAAYPLWKTAQRATADTAEGLEETVRRLDVVVAKLGTEGA